VVPLPLILPLPPLPLLPLLLLPLLPLATTATSATATNATTTTTTTTVTTTAALLRPSGGRKLQHLVSPVSGQVFGFDPETNTVIPSNVAGGTLPTTNEVPKGDVTLGDAPKPQTWFPVLRRRP
jgi:hypothetical protein